MPSQHRITTAALVNICGAVGRVDAMQFTVLTIFPELFEPFWRHGIVKQAIEKGIVSADTVNIRDYTSDRHRTTDDRPYGGGCGMVMKPEPLADAINTVRKKAPQSKTILLTPQGRRFDQATAGLLSRHDHLTVICGRYEGIDERIGYNYVDYEISVGDVILSGGEVAAMLIVDAVVRLLPGSLGNVESAGSDSFADNRLEHAQFTRPATFDADAVPEVLLSGNHEEIEKWRRESALIRTFLKRRELLQKRPLAEHEIDILKKWCTDLEDLLRAQSSSGIDALSGG